MEHNYINGFSTQRTQIELVLCSASPRRNDLMKLCGLPFRTAVSATDERGIAAAVMGGDDGKVSPATAASLSLALATAKAEAVRRIEQPEQPCIYIGSDTVVHHREMILGKPTDADEANAMLSDLCGHEHSVFTAVAFLASHPDLPELAHSPADSFVRRTRVRFRILDQIQENLIKKYVAGGSPFDKAGGYGIQDEGALLIDSIRGDFYTVMGFPIAEVYRRLIKLLDGPPFNESC